MTLIVTGLGVRLEVGSISRRVIDDFSAAHPAPIPPTKKMPIFGGDEEVEDTESPEYKRAILSYRLQLAHDQFELLNDAIKILDNEWKQSETYQELIDIGVARQDSQSDFLRYVALTDEDMCGVIDEIFYQSTVTERGIDEATNQFGVLWYKQDIRAWRIKTVPAQFRRIFEDREAARFALMSWDNFCALTGREQSAIVAHYRLRNHLDYLIAKENQK